MPFNYDYDEPRRLITQSRLSSYSTSIATENDAQLFGAYSWNLAVVGAFYPLLQIIEVSLRNAISNAAKLKAEQAGVNGFGSTTFLLGRRVMIKVNRLRQSKLKSSKEKLKLQKEQQKKHWKIKGKSTLHQTMIRLSLRLISLPGNIF